MYDSEAKFVAALKKRLNNVGWDVQRLESSMTGVGIPDMFVQGHGTDCFIEAKNIKSKMPTVKFTVPWRPGQVAWALDYERAHHFTKRCWTVCAFNDGVLWLMVTRKYYDENRIRMDNPFLFKFTWDEFRALDLTDFLVTNNEKRLII